MLVLDHLAVICADLDAGCAWVEAQLGVSLQAGGRHDRYGTHNRLLGLDGGLYLEVIAPDHTVTPDGPRWFGLDHAPAHPRLGNWICQASRLGGFADIAGPAVDLRRGDLNWRITVPEDGSLPLGGGFPTLIKWGADVTHPAAALVPSGLRLTQLRVLTPDAGLVTGHCGPMDPRVVVEEADTCALEAVFQTPSGLVVLS